ncbi:MAG: hypothetical protein JHC33_03355 [Ignisphaera sp.]|nr:hypothetical protein [Ignisphaera sp.]
MTTFTAADKAIAMIAQESMVKEFYGKNVVKHSGPRTADTRWSFNSDKKETSNEEVYADTVKVVAAEETVKETLKDPKANSKAPTMYTIFRNNREYDVSESLEFSQKLVRDDILERMFIAGVEVVAGLKGTAHEARDLARILNRATELAADYNIVKNF